MVQPGDDDGLRRGSCHGCAVTLADGSFARVCHEGPVFSGDAIYGVASEDGGTVTGSIETTTGSRDLSVRLGPLTLAHPIDQRLGHDGALRTRRGFRSRDPESSAGVGVRAQDHHAGAAPGNAPPRILETPGGHDQRHRSVGRGTGRLYPRPAAQAPPFPAQSS